MAEIKFLGTAGARFVVAKQLRSSAGTVIRSDKAAIILDPGPGTLTRLAKSRPKIDVTKLDGVIVTHTHLDHSNDANILIDAFTEGGFKKKGVLFTTEEALNSKNKVILPYLKPFLKNIYILKHKKNYSIKDISFTAYKHRHSVETYGIKFTIDKKIVSFIVDTSYFPGILDYYKDSNILIMNTVRFAPKEGILHLSVEDVKKIVPEIKPDKIILTHFGMTMLRKKPFIIAKKLSEKLGREIIAATDGMTVKV